MQDPAQAPSEERQELLEAILSTPAIRRSVSATYLELLVPARAAYEVWIWMLLRYVPSRTYVDE